MKSFVTKLADFKSIDIKKLVLPKPDIFEKYKKNIIEHSKNQISEILAIDAINKIVSYDSGVEAREVFFDLVEKESEFTLDKEDVINRINLIVEKMKTWFLEGQFELIVNKPDFRIWVNIRAQKDIIFALLLSAMAKELNVSVDQDEVISLVIGSEEIKNKSIRKELIEDAKTFILQREILKFMIFKGGE